MAPNVNSPAKTTSDTRQSYAYLVACKRDIQKVQDLGIVTLPATVLRHITTAINELRGMIKFRD